MSNANASEGTSMCGVMLPFEIIIARSFNNTRLSCPYLRAASLRPRSSSACRILSRVLPTLRRSCSEVPSLEGRTWVLHALIALSARSVGRLVGSSSARRYISKELPEMKQDPFGFFKLPTALSVVLPLGIGTEFSAYRATFWTLHCPSSLSSHGTAVRSAMTPFVSSIWGAAKESGVGGAAAIQAGGHRVADCRGCCKADGSAQAERCGLPGGGWTGWFGDDFSWSNFDTAPTMRVG